MRFALLVLVLTGCATATVAPPRALPPFDPPAGYHDAPGEPAPPNRIEVVKRTPHLLVERLTITPRVPAALERVEGATEPIVVVLHRPQPPSDRPLPLVLMSPILGSSSVLVTEFATAFTRRGLAAALVERKPFRFDPSRSLDEAEAEMRLLVIRSRQALDALLATGDYDPSRLGTFGVSAGAIVSATLAGAEPRLRAHVFVLAGGPLADVLVDTEERRFRRYAEELERARGIGREEVRRMLRASILTDPVRLAHRVDPASVLLVLARGDRSVPYAHGLVLREALGRPRALVLPFGHKTSFVLLPVIQQEAAAFLARRLDAPQRP